MNRRAFIVAAIAPLVVKSVSGIPNPIPELQIEVVRVGIIPGRQIKGTWTMELAKNWYDPDEDDIIEQ